MIKKLKNIVSILLVVVVLTPIATKFFDSFVHHHDHFICKAKNENHFHERHDECPIVNFELSLYALNKIIYETQKTYYWGQLLVGSISNNYCSGSKYSFQLRAPPFSSNSHFSI